MADVPTFRVALESSGEELVDEALHRGDIGLGASVDHDQRGHRVGLDEAGMELGGLSGLGGGWQERCGVVLLHV